MTGPVSDILPGSDGDVDQQARSQWFHDHYGVAADEILAFVDGDDPLAGRDVADIGCGDGITDLGVAVKGRPRRLVGYDLNPTNTAGLLAQAREQDVVQELPPELEFAVTGETQIPAEDSSFDVVISWSAFEHVLQPVEVLREIRRILRPDGTFFLQLWPFYFSEHGSHLWHWFPEGFANQRFGEDEIAETLRRDTETDPSWIETKIHDNRTLNRITLDGLHNALLTAGFTVAKVELMSHAVHLTPELNRFALSDLTISGVKLLATPQR